MKYNTFLFCLTLTLLARCKKDDFREVSGQVVEFGTGTPIDNALVIITALEGGEVLGNPGTSVIKDSIRTDENGNYMVRADGSALQINAFKDGYDSRNNYEPIGSFENEYKNVTLTLDPYAWLDVTLKNVSGAEELNFGISTNNKFQTILGDISHKVLERQLGNRNKTLGIYKVQNGETINISQSVYLPKHDTTFFYLEY